MATRSWTLIDIDQNICLESLAVDGKQLGGAAAAGSVRLVTLRGGLRDGLRLLQIDNGALRLALLPDRGMGIWKAWHGDTEIGWHSPLQGPVHPRWVPLLEPSGLGWLDGFDELLVRCGLFSNGAPDFDSQNRLICPLHGRIANLPAHHLRLELDEPTGRIRVVGVVDETRFHFQKLRLTSTVTLDPGSLAVSIHDEVENLSGNPGEMQLLYHINFGPPIHGPGGQLVAAVQELAPRDAHAATDVAGWHSYGPPEAAAVERVYFMQLRSDADGRTRTLLKAADGAPGVSLQFNTAQLPCFTQWKNSPPEADGYVTGLEPGTNFPNPRSYESDQGRVVTLAAGGKVAFDLTLEVHPDAQGVQATEDAIGALQGDSQPQVHTQPRAGWSAT